MQCHEHHGMRVLRQDYPVEVPGVLYDSITIKEGKGANNSTLLREIEAASKALSPGIALKDIRWLKDRSKESTSSQSSQREPRTRGTVIISCSSQQAREIMVRGGIVICGGKYDANLFEWSIVTKQCFRCGEWGHSQNACRKKATCGHCAESHETRDCRNKDKPRCGNCGQSHKGWQKKVCRAFGAYFLGINKKRAECRAATIEMRARPQASPSMVEDGFAFVASKRKALTQGGTTQKRPVGRPSAISQAASEENQSKLRVLSRQVTVEEEAESGAVMEGIEATQSQ